jgi:hypothetical protein
VAGVSVIITLARGLTDASPDHVVRSYRTPSSATSQRTGRSLGATYTPSWLPVTERRADTSSGRRAMVSAITARRMRTAEYRYSACPGRHSAPNLRTARSLADHIQSCRTPPKPASRSSSTVERAPPDTICASPRRAQASRPTDVTVRAVSVGVTSASHVIQPYRLA